MWNQAFCVRNSTDSFEFPINSWLWIQDLILSCFQETQIFDQTFFPFFSGIVNVIIFYYPLFIASTLKKGSEVLFMSRLCVVKFNKSLGCDWKHE